MQIRRIIALATALLMGATALHAQLYIKTKPYSIFNRLPDSLMREEMETDRPDVTESPYTVDAGHIQYESDILRYNKRAEAGNINKQLLIDPFTFKIGLTQSSDLQVAFESYRIESHLEDDGQKESLGNVGSWMLRLKKNLMGNNNGAFALAVMPYVKLPCNKFFDHHNLEGGLIIPAQYKFTDEFLVGLQEKFGLVADEDVYHFQLSQSLSFGYTLFDKLKIIAEVYYDSDFSEIEFHTNGALQYNLSKNLAIDVGVIEGILVKDHQYYTGVAWRW